MHLFQLGNADWNDQLTCNSDLTVPESEDKPSM